MVKIKFRFVDQGFLTPRGTKSQFSSDVDSDPFSWDMCVT